MLAARVGVGGCLPVVVTSKVTMSRIRRGNQTDALDLTAEEGHVQLNNDYVTPPATSWPDVAGRGGGLAAKRSEQLRFLGVEGAHQGGSWRKCDGHSEEGEQNEARLGHFFPIWRPPQGLPWTAFTLICGFLPEPALLLVVDLHLSPSPSGLFMEELGGLTYEISHTVGPSRRWIATPPFTMRENLPIARSNVPTTDTSAAVVRLCCFSERRKDKGRELAAFPERMADIRIIHGRRPFHSRLSLSPLPTL